MAKLDIIYTKDNEYYTPVKVIEYFGMFDYDPATTKEKAKEFGVFDYDTIETDGLLKDWSVFKKIWINPPFTKKYEFLQKAVETYKTNNNIYIYILLPIEYLTTNKFRKAIQDIKAKIYIPNGRINFESGLGKQGKSPAFGSVILRLQNEWEIDLINIDNIR